MSLPRPAGHPAQPQSSSSVPGDLDACVARAMEGVVASPWRRRAMREELLSHALEAYEDELSRAGTPPADAVARVARRLGDGADLAEQLQSAVPPLERWVFRWSARKETPMSRWLWIVAVAVILVGTAIVMPALAEHYQHQAEWGAVALPFAAGALITLAGVGTVAYGIAEKVRRRTA